jgi:hypothetical protein
MRSIVVACVAFGALGIADSTFASADGVAPPVKWEEIKRETVGSINAGLKRDMPTVDVGIYVPSNLDPAFVAGFSLDGLLLEFRRAQQIFADAGVQLRLSWVKTGLVDPRFLEIQANDMAGETPPGRRVNMYEDTLRQKSSLSPEAAAAFESIVEKYEGADRTVHIVVLQDVFMSFFEKLDERTYEVRTITTGGLSFPSYSYPGLPRHLRGVITVTRNDLMQRLIAHELGHKLMNVSHEYRGVNPQHEVRADGGLMLYGKGTEIASGVEGRWHRERLHLSPYVYRMDAVGRKQWNPDYREAGHYYDPIYGDYVVRFAPDAPTGAPPP